MEQLIKKLYHNTIISKIFHTLLFCIKRELNGCDSVLDLGCGSDSPIRFANNIKFSIGVDAYEPYIIESRRKGIHTKYLLDNISNLEFEPKSFDAILLIDVLEHLSIDEGLSLLKKSELWSKKKIIISTPNGFLPQKIIDGNLLQIHNSGWTPKLFKELDYKVYGMAGFKLFRGKNMSDHGGDIYSTIKFKPKFFWLIISQLSQLFAYYLPKFAFSLFSVKKID